MALKVEFKKSKKSAEWDGRFASILDLAEEHGVEIENDCRQGICGSCKTRLLSGKVEMEVEDGLNGEDIEQNLILPCVAVPITDVSVEA